MKKKNLFLISLLLLTISFSSCKAENKATNNKPVSSVDVAVLSPEGNNTTSEKKSSEGNNTVPSNTVPSISNPAPPPIEQPKKSESFKKGDKGDEVKEIQQKLNKFGYSLNADGIFGSSTYSALIDFQKKNKIPANGIVDSNTLICLDKKPTSATMYKPPTPAAKPKTNDTSALEQYVNSRSFTSQTDYFIWIDLSKQKVNIFNGSNNNWKLIKSMTCSSGKASTPTIKGTFTVGSKGSYFIADGGARCKYYTQISGNYLFHSILYDNKGERVVDGTLGIPKSHGCVRLALENAKYIYDNIPRGTLIWSN